MDRGLFKRLSGWGLLVVAGLATVFGVWAIGAYVWGVVEVWDAPDRSWVFWGLALVFLGLAGLGVGLVAGLAGRAMLRASRE